jgi:hypothetical protein
MVNVGKECEAQEKSVEKCRRLSPFLRLLHHISKGGYLLSMSKYILENLFDCSRYSQVGRTQYGS